jgi:acetyl-CoA carboxylase biotin carboxylase subunit
MGEAAVKLVQAAGYTNAGTVEFLLDAEENFYFLEVNTRLQVEHPVTELVTGLDLVHLQLHIAQGLALPITQQDVQLRGHAMECRIYAEDPENNFFPSPGRITRWAEAGGPGIRVDSGVYTGWIVPLDYDPMLAKLIAYAPTRQGAIARLLRALDDTFVGGIKSNIGLFHRLLKDENFCAARMHTGYLDKLLASGSAAEAEATPETDAMFRAAAVAAVALAHEGEGAEVAITRPASSPARASAWKQAALQEGLRR